MMKLTPEVAIVALSIVIVPYLVMVNRSSKPDWIEPECTSYQVRKIESPNQKFVAEYVNQKCPGSIKAYVWVFSKENLQTQWSAFIAPATTRTGSSLSEPTLALDLVWPSNSELEISFPRDVKPESKEGDRNGIRITYQRLGS